MVARTVGGEVRGAVPRDDPPDRRRRTEPVLVDRRKHVDYTGRETTRPGIRARMELGDGDATPDEIEREVTPLDHAIDVVNDAAARLERAAHGTAIERDAKAAELDALPGSAWARGVDADIAALKDAVAKRPRWHTLKLAGKWISGAAVITALGLAIRALIAHGDGQATSRAEKLLLHRHEAQMRSVFAALYYIAGKLGIELRLDDNTPKDSP